MVGVGSRAGAVLLRELAAACGLADQVTVALADTYRAASLHAPGQVFADLAVAVADGETSMDGIERVNRPGFDAGFLFWDGGGHARETVRRCDEGEGGSSGPVREHREDYD